MARDQPSCAPGESRRPPAEAHRRVVLRAHDTATLYSRADVSKKLGLWLELSYRLGGKSIDQGIIYDSHKNQIRRRRKLHSHYIMFS